MFVRYLIVVVAVMIATSSAHAITISVAKIDKGAVQVKGKGAAPLALLTWEGQSVAQASARGTFRLATSVLPHDCVGELSDGIATVSVVVEQCGPSSGIVQGPPGPKGDPGIKGEKGDAGQQGEPGPGGAGLVLKDSAGVLVGPFDEGSGGVYIATPEGPLNLPNGYLAGGSVSFHLYHASADCSGDILYPSNPNVLVLYPVAGSAGSTILYVPRTGTSTLVQSDETGPATMESCLPPSVFITPDRCCCPSPGCFSASSMVVGAPPAFDTSIFTPPFHAELQ